MQLEARLEDLVKSEDEKLIEIHRNSEDWGVETIHGLLEEDGWLYWTGLWQHRRYSVYRAWKKGKILLGD